jgi:hypothetical protein
MDSADLKINESAFDKGMRWLLNASSIGVVAVLPFTVQQYRSGEQPNPVFLLASIATIARCSGRALGALERWKDAGAAKELSQVRNELVQLRSMLENEVDDQVSKLFEPRKVTQNLTRPNIP